MKPEIKTYLLNDDNEKFFGEGPYQLLKGVEKYGSLKAAASEIGMAYSKAVKLIHTAEEALQFDLTEKTIGGKSGGGSQLSEKGKDFVTKYEQYKRLCKEANMRIYSEIFK